MRLIKKTKNESLTIEEGTSKALTYTHNGIRFLLYEIKLNSQEV